MEKEYPAALNAAQVLGNLSETEKKIYWDLFINRTDAYTVHQPDGQYRAIKSELTPEILFGDSTIAGYQLNENNEIKWLCYDIDVDKSIHSRPDFDLKCWIVKLQQQTQEIRNQLVRMGIPSYVEFSGKKGYHIWVFLEALTKAKTAKKYFQNILSYRKLFPEINVEFFPKQESTNGRYGNFVKPPLQRHQSTGNFSYFVDDDFNAINQLPLIEKYTIVEAATSEPVIPIIEPSVTSAKVTQPILYKGPRIDFKECIDEELKHLPSAVDFLSFKITDRETWIKCGFALASLGEDGRKYFLKLSDNPKYPEDTPETINEKFDDLLRNKREKISLSTLFFEAKRLGFQYPSMDQDFYEILLQMFEEDDNRDPNKLIGFPLNKFSIMAEKLDGIQPGFYLLGAESNVGKTAVLTNLCLDALETNPDIQVIYFSLDDSVRYATYRFLSILTGMGINQVRKPKQNPSLFPFLRSKRVLFLNYIKTGRLVLKDIAKVSHIDHLETEIKKITDKTKLMVFIDGLYNLEVAENNSIREENIERARKVKYLVDVYRIPVFTTGELRKKTQDQGKDKAPTLHDLMESSKYAYNANIVWMLYAKQADLRMPTPVLTLEYVKNKLSDYKGMQSLMFERGKGIISEVPQIVTTLVTSAPGTGEDI